MEYSVDISTVPSREVAVTRFHITTSEIGTAMAPRIGAAFGTVMEQLARSGATPVGPAVAVYEQAGDGVDVAAGFPVEGGFDPAGAVGRLVIGGREVAHTTHVGTYDRLVEAYDALRSGAAAQGRSLDDTAPMWEEYWSDASTPADETRTDVFWPVVPAETAH